MMMLNTVKSDRLIFIDNLRALTFLLLVFDHTIHAYALDFAQYHFFKDYDRSVVCDVFYLFDNSIIMPMLFFIFGLCVFPALRQKGTWAYIKERILKLGVPYVVGIPCIVPLLVYPKYIFNTQNDISYVDFWLHIYFVEKLQGGGPFWVLFSLALYTSILISVTKIGSIFISRDTIQNIMNGITRFPKLSGLVFIITSIILLGYGNIKWGAPWWIGLDHMETYGETWRIVADKIITLFHLQGSRFMLHAQYFITGALIGSTVLYEKNFWQRIADRWLTFTLLMILFTVAYISYVLAYIHDGAFNDDIQRLLLDDFSWSHLMAIFYEQRVDRVLTRTTLQAIMIVLQVAACLSLSIKFIDKSTPFLCSLAACSYGIFLLHEVPVIGLQSWFNGMDLPIIIKVILIFSLGLASTWFVVKQLKKIAWINRII